MPKKVLVFPATPTSEPSPIFVRHRLNPSIGPSRYELELIGILTTLPVATVVDQAADASEITNRRSEVAAVTADADPSFCSIKEG